jgi:hypothetical protein
MIHHHFLQSDHFLGPVVEASFSRATVLCQLRLDFQDIGIVKGSFAVMLRHQDIHGKFEATLGAPLASSVNLDSFILLRLLEVLPLPESDTRLGQRCDKLMADAPDMAASALNHCLVQYDVLGAFVMDSGSGLARFAGDPGALGAIEQYCVFVPPPPLLDILTNGVVNPLQRIHFGELRTSETQSSQRHAQKILLSMLDIRGKRTAVFGKTRLGKSNAVKLVVQGMLDVTHESQNVGQLIFDVNGEYANDNPQDGNQSIASIYQDRCLVYHLSPRGGNEHGRLLRFNFYEQSDKALSILRELLPPVMAESDYVQPLLNCRVPALVRLPDETDEQVSRRVRKIMLLWTLLDIAGFDFNQDKLTEVLTGLGIRQPFNPQLPQALRNNVYQSILHKPTPPAPNNFRDMVTEMTGVARFMLDYENDPALVRKDEPLFDLDEKVMARFLNPKSSAGPYVLRSCLPFHSCEGDNFMTEVLAALETGKTAIIDLGSASEQIVRYFSRTLSTAVFQTQEAKFVSNTLHGRFVQIYFEEAHMIFPQSTGPVTDIYSRFAKEGAKFNIGIAYSTQSPSTVNKDLLGQTENFFIGHLSSRTETELLSSVQHAFRGLEDEIMHWRTPGLMRVLTYSHRYPLPVQVARFTGQSLLAG